MPDYDDLIIGSGMAGLTVASLLARKGRRVGVLEAHDKPGGYAHTFDMGQFRFCAQVHYIFSCGEGETIHRLLSHLELDQEVTFHRLDPEGYDHIVVAGDRHRIPTGLSKYRERLIYRYPHAEEPLRRYFRVICALRDELDAMPHQLGLRDLATAPLRFPRLLRHLRWTLQRLFDSLKMPTKLQAVLAGQAGDYLLPPEDVSLLLHVALVTGYDGGAYYPTHHFSSLVDSLVRRVEESPGCDLLLKQRVAALECDGAAIRAAVTAEGRRFTARRYISNADPAKTLQLLRGATLPSKKASLAYAYSSANFTLYLGIRNIDLRDHGFGNHNVWHYPHDDLNRMYRVQGQQHNLDDPWLFMSTPTLHTEAPGLAPPGHQILEVATSCDYEYFARLRRNDPKAYTRAKVAVRDRILDVIQERYVPKLRDNLSMKLAGTPLTNERFVNAPRGNAYGANLTPENMFPRVGQKSPVDNLWFANATAGYPSVAGTVSAGLRLYQALEGERI